MGEDYYSNKALEYCEKYGIINYRVKGNTLIYNVSYPKYLGRPHYTIQHIIDLDNGNCISSKTLKRYDKNGVFNRG